MKGYVSVTRGGAGSVDPGKRPNRLGPQSMQSLLSSNDGSKRGTIVRCMHRSAAASSGAVAVTSPAAGVMVATTYTFSPGREQAHAA